MKDRDMLVLAAVACGHNWFDWTPTLIRDEHGRLYAPEWPHDWNPLQNNEDAFALAVRIGKTIDFAQFAGKPDPELSARIEIVRDAVEYVRKLAGPQ